MREYVKLLRPHHYIKNLLIFFPLFFSGKMFEKNLLVADILGFIAFSCVCSAIYIINDVHDVEQDKLHPSKKNRPIASGAISKRNAIVMAIGLLFMSFFILNGYQVNWKIIFWILLYVALNLFYSLYGKNIAVLDVVILGLGYPIRVLFGGALVDVRVSSWLFLTVLFISLYLALGKRSGELSKIESKSEYETRAVLNKYTKDYLEHNMYLNLALGMVFYSLWGIEKRELLVFSVPLVLAICMKYNLLIINKTDGDPVTSLLSSKSLVVMVLIYICVMTIFIYVV